jgi:hypothetical protein
MIRRVIGKGLLFALLLPAVWAGPAEGGRDGEIEGIVTFRGEAREGVTIEVYLEARKSRGGMPFSTSVTGKEGRFAIQLPPGEYYLWAREPPPEFGPPGVREYPANPVRLAAGQRVTLEPLRLLAAGGREEAVIPGDAGLSGVTGYEGEPAEGAAVMVYPGDRELLTGPGYLSLAVSDGEGRFRIDLAPGTYRLAARKRQGGELMGVLREGDLTAEYEGNPVEVTSGSYRDLGTIPLRLVDSARLAERTARGLPSPSPTRLKGKVIDTGGKPLAGQFVFVYRDQAMIGRPDFITTSAGDGTFAVDLPGGGTYYVGARNRSGGPRQPGEMVGRVEDSADSSVQVEEGSEREGLAITMEAVW